MSQSRALFLPDGETYNDYCLEHVSRAIGKGLFETRRGGGERGTHGNGVRSQPVMRSALPERLLLYMYCWS